MGGLGAYDQTNPQPFCRTRPGRARFTSMRRVVPRNGGSVFGMFVIKNQKYIVVASKMSTHRCDRPTGDGPTEISTSHVTNGPQSCRPILLTCVHTLTLSSRLHVKQPRLKVVWVRSACRMLCTRNKVMYLQRTTSSVRIGQALLVQATSNFEALQWRGTP